MIWNITAHLPDWVQNEIIRSIVLSINLDSCFILEKAKSELIKLNFIPLTTNKFKLVWCLFLQNKINGMKIVSLSCKFCTQTKV